MKPLVVKAETPMSLPHVSPGKSTDTRDFPERKANTLIKSYAGSGENAARMWAGSPILRVSSEK